MSRFTEETANAEIKRLKQQVDMLTPVVEAAQEWTMACQYANQCPTKKGYLKAVLKRLNDEVEDYEIWEKGL